MNSEHIILAFLWILYCALHSLLASVGVKKRVHKFTGSSFRFYRLFYTLFAAVSLAAILYYQFSVTSMRLFTSTTLTKITGGFIAALGIGLMAVCIKKYFLSLSGLKSLYQETPYAELMITGIHRYIRHPLYTGTFLAIWGTWLLFPSFSFLITNIIITVYTLYAIRLEEDKLVAEFGDQYRTYQKMVPKLIPRL